MGGINLACLAVWVVSPNCIGCKLVECEIFQTLSFGVGLRVLMVGDLYAEHVEWNLLLNTRRGNSYVITATSTSV